MSPAPPLAAATLDAPFPARDLNLSPAAVHSYWNSVGIQEVIAGMERCEPWTIDESPRAEQVLDELSQSFSGATSAAITVSVTRRPQEVVELMAYLRSGRALLLFGWLAEVNPALAGTLVRAVQDEFTDFGSLLLDRIAALERQHLLSRVFSPERFALVLESLEDAGLNSMEER